MSSDLKRPPSLFPGGHFLDIEGLSLPAATYLLDRAEVFLAQNRSSHKKTYLLKGLTQINLFFESSTRTQASFELAGKRLGADVMNMATGHLSTRKGETLIDTATTLNAMTPDLLVVRHYCSGAAALLANQVGCSVINAGDGAHAHPTQALLDALTIRLGKGRIDGLKVAICGDILHSRVARSNILLLTLLGACVRLVAPRTLLPACVEDWGVDVFTSLSEGVKDVDVIMMLRLQKERMQGECYIPSVREYFCYFGLDRDKVRHARPDVLILHPGPMNRGVEISSELADGPQSRIRTQVEMGVAVRMAVLSELMAQKNVEPDTELVEVPGGC